jgi:hypothetical protein
LRFLILVLITIGLIIVTLFGLRALMAFREIQGNPPAPMDVFMQTQPEEPDVELIRDWMTVPFIARMYEIPPSILYQALGIPARGNEEKSLTQLNSKFFPEAPGIVEIKIKAAVLENFRRDLPPNPPAP